MSATLFRKAAVKASRKRLYGDLLLQRPLPLDLCIWFICLSGFIALLYLFTGTYSRKQAVTGWLEPDSGLKQVIPAQSGQISRVLVQEGDTVRKGQVLLLITTDTSFHEGVKRDEVTEQGMRVQVRMLERRLQEVHDRAALEQQRHHAEIAGMDKILRQEETLLSGEQASFTLHQRSLERARELTRKGHLSDADFDQVRLKWLSQNSAIERQQLRILNLNHDLKSRTSEWHIISQGLIEEGLQIEQSLEEARSRLDQHRAGSEIEIVAPVSGHIASLNTSEGKAVQPSHSLMSLVPAESSLQAILAIPSDAVGFINAGQKLRIRYTAYAYQKFGSFEAVIHSVAAAPSDIHSTEGRPIFIVKASLASQSVEAFGEFIPLRSGLTLAADIELESRSLLEWLLEPLYSLVKAG